MAKKANKRKVLATTVDAQILEARANAKRIRAHAALERQIATSAKRLQRLIETRDASLFILARDIVERDGQYTLETKGAAANAD